MQILIVESNEHLAMIWAKHLSRLGNSTFHAPTADEAFTALRDRHFDVILINLMLDEGTSLGVADYVRLRFPDTNLVFVTNSSFFSDGSIFDYVPTARAILKSATDPVDLAAIVEYYGAYR